MNNEHAKILISYARQVSQVRLKHRTRLKTFLQASISGLSFTMFVYVLSNILQILILLMSEKA